MADPLDVGNGLIGGGGITYVYTDFELTAAVGDGFIDAPDIDISLSAQSALLRVGSGTIGAGLPALSFQDWSAELVTGSGTISTGNAQIRDIVRALFPALSPSDRSFEPPEYAISKYKAMNGAKSRRLWASQPGGGTLDLVFENIDDAAAESILAAHDVAKGAANDVILPDAVLSGAEGDLLAYMRSPGGQAWSFEGPPEIESVKEGMSTVRVKLSARRKVKFNSVGSVGGTFAVGAAPVDEIDPGGYANCDITGSAEDPFIGSVVLLLPLNAEHGFADLSSYEHVMTPVGSPVIVTSDLDFPDGALDLNGTTQVLRSPASSALVLGTQPFCIEFYLKPDVVSSNDGIFTYTLSDQETVSGASMSLQDPSNVVWSVNGAGDGGQGAVQVSTRQHVAVTRDAVGDVRLFVGGDLADPVILDKSLSNMTADRLTIGFYFSFASSFFYNGRINWFRITKGVPRYTEPFTPPAVPYPIV